MISLSSLLTIAHLIGLIVGVGAATVKVALLLRTLSDPTSIPTYLQVSKPITMHIVFGMIVLTLSGVGFLLTGYPLTRRLTMKLFFVVSLWVLGPVIDNFAEPRYRKLATEGSESVRPAFAQAQRYYISLEIVATLLFYVIIVYWLA
jgi:hypothetical protein